MLFRDDPAGPVAITQPAHAGVAGQLARAWGNGDFPKPEPWEAVCVAAERHDDGWLAWEAAPALDPATGRPYSFLTLPRAEHLAIWSSAGPTVLALGRYPALLVSLHGTGLYDRRGQEADEIGEFLRQQRAFQERLLTSLRAEPHFARHAAPDVIDRNRRLIAVWDTLSLVICGGRRDRLRVDGVPGGEGQESLTLTPIGGDVTRFTIAPWPFAAETVALTFEGRRLVGQFGDEEAMRTALTEAPWVSFVAHLVIASETGVGPSGGR